MNVGTGVRGSMIGLVFMLDIGEQVVLYGMEANAPLCWRRNVQMYASAAYS